MSQTVVYLKTDPRPLGGIGDTIADIIRGHLINGPRQRHKLMRDVEAEIRERDLTKSKRYGASIMTRLLDRGDLAIEAGPAKEVKLKHSRLLRLLEKLCVELNALGNNDPVAGELEAVVNRLVRLLEERGML